MLFFWSFGGFFLAFFGIFWVILGVILGQFINNIRLPWVWMHHTTTTNLVWRRGQFWGCCRNISNHIIITAPPAWPVLKAPDLKWQINNLAEVSYFSYQNSKRNSWGIPKIFHGHLLLSWGNPRNLLTNIRFFCPQKQMTLEFFKNLPIAF